MFLRTSSLQVYIYKAQTAQKPLFILTHAKQFKFHRVTIDVWLRHEDNDTKYTSQTHSYNTRTRTLYTGKIIIVKTNTTK